MRRSISCRMKLKMASMWGVDSASTQRIGCSLSIPPPRKEREGGKKLNTAMQLRAQPRKQQQSLKEQTQK